MRQVVRLADGQEPLEGGQEQRGQLAADVVAIQVGARPGTAA